MRLQRRGFDCLAMSHQFSEINQVTADAKRGDTLEPVLPICDPDQAKQRERTSYRAGVELRCQVACCLGWPRSGAA